LISENVVKKDQGSERLILFNMTETPSLLGYKTAKLVKKLVNKGFLKVFKLPDSKMFYLNRSEDEYLVRTVTPSGLPKDFDLIRSFLVTSCINAPAFFFLILKHRN
jgi:hypothetical protein